ncbi:MAG: hypothetical protein HQK67_08870, partial [Desulfamplus sp.]|nr:hypothetical protein [Desulfamplus sp.]
IIIPEKNKKDLYDLPLSVKKKINFICVQNLDQVLEVAFVEKEEDIQNKEEAEPEKTMLATEVNIQEEVSEDEVAEDGDSEDNASEDGDSEDEVSEDGDSEDNDSDINNFEDGASEATSK